MGRWGHSANQGACPQPLGLYCQPFALEPRPQPLRAVSPTILIGSNILIGSTIYFANHFARRLRSPPAVAQSATAPLRQGQHSPRMSIAEGASRGVGGTERNEVSPYGRLIDGQWRLAVGLPGRFRGRRAMARANTFRDDDG